MNSLPQDSTLAAQLVEAARRDIETYLNAEDPNREAAGRAALQDLNAAIRVLSTVRQRLLVEISGKDESALEWVAGNSGPGFRLPKE